MQSHSSVVWKTKKGDIDRKRRGKKDRRYSGKEIEREYEIVRGRRDEKLNTDIGMIEWGWAWLLDQQQFYSLSFCNLYFPSRRFMINESMLKKHYCLFCSSLSHWSLGPYSGQHLGMKWKDDAIGFGVYMHRCCLLPLKCISLPQATNWINWLFLWHICYLSSSYIRMAVCFSVSTFRPDSPGDSLRAPIWFYSHPAEIFANYHPHVVAA